MRTVAIIPARGGSKGIPRKNLAMCGGMSLIERCCETAIAAKMLDAVLVSSDDDEILAEASKVPGIYIHKRSAELATDEATTESVLLDALAWCMRKGWDPAVLVLLQCTSPLTLPEDIDRTVQEMRPLIDHCFTVARFHGFVWREEAPPANLHPEEEKRWKTLREPLHQSQDRFRPRRQDAAPAYIETGAVYAMRTSSFIHERSRFCEQGALCEVPAERAIEIDEPIDLEIADFLLRRRMEKAS